MPRTSDRASLGLLADVAERRGALAAAGASAGLALAVAAGRVGVAAVAATLPLLAVVAGRALGALERTPKTVRWAGLVLGLLGASTFVWRTRTTDTLDANPLDAAALVRVALVASAGTAALMVASRRPAMRSLPSSLRWLGAYIAVAAVSGLASPLPVQALYRAFELGIGFVAVIAALSLLEAWPPAVLVRLLVGGIGAVLALVWAEALVVPTRAWSPSVSAIPYELEGYLPAYASNTVGMLGGLLALYGLAGAGRRRHASSLALAAGVATLVASQYRTGIVAFAAVGLLVLGRRRPAPVAVLVLAAVPLVAAVGWSNLSTRGAETFSKGRPELVATLDNRTVYWRAAEPLIRERPLLGWGLNVESRRVLVSLGEDGTSTIHSTWVEALLGTGLVGAAALCLAFLTALLQAVRVRASPVGLAVSAMLGFLTVRSLTGTTVELFDIGFLVFAGLAFTAARLDYDVTARSSS